MSFDTKSTTAYGSITEVKLTDKGAGYTEVPESQLSKQL